MKFLEERKKDIYLVGGAVRDQLLGLPIKDRDWVITGATNQELLEAGFEQVGKDFPVFLHPVTKEEYALARVEKKIGIGYHGFICETNSNVSIEQDLSRRDLTINAMAIDYTGKIIDPFQGEVDLENRVLRHVSDAFMEDPLRVLRVARFASKLSNLSFKIADETFNLMLKLSLSDDFKNLTPQRVWIEIVKSLNEDDPTVFFQILHDCQALETLWPDLNCLWGIPQKKEYHPEIDTGIHTMMSLKIASKLSHSGPVRFATLCHDLGKGVTPKELLPGHAGHELRGVKLIENFAKKYKIPHEFLVLAKLVSEYHLHCHKVLELRPNTIVNLLESLKAYQNPQILKNFLLVCKADARGRKGLEDTLYQQADILWNLYLLTKDVDSTQWLNIGLEGKEIGKKIRTERIQRIKKTKRK